MSFYDNTIDRIYRHVNMDYVRGFVTRVSPLL